MVDISCFTPICCILHIGYLGVLGLDSILKFSCFRFWCSNVIPCYNPKKIIPTIILWNKTCYTYTAEKYKLNERIMYEKKKILSKFQYIGLILCLKEYFSKERDLGLVSLAFCHDRSMVRISIWNTSSPFYWWSFGHYSSPLDVSLLSSFSMISLN